MLDVLRHAQNPAKIPLTPAFKRDLHWFENFLPEFNGVSMYGHRTPHHTFELDACLTALGGGGGGGGGVGGHWHNMAYHLPVPRGYKNLDIVHLEMVNILVAVRIFGLHWKKGRILV